MLSLNTIELSDDVKFLNCNNRCSLALIPKKASRYKIAMCALAILLHLLPAQLLLVKKYFLLLSDFIPFFLLARNTKSRSLRHLSFQHPVPFETTKTFVRRIRNKITFPFSKSFLSKFCKSLKKAQLLI